jgi:peptide deformylase
MAVDATDAANNMIIINNIDSLKKKCEEVSSLEEAELIIKYLEDELNNSAKLGTPGIGLAAPQCGKYKHVAIIRLGNLSIDLINAKIIKSYDEIIFDGEGCLSFPDKILKTKRYNEIVVGNNLCYPHTFTATGLLAIAIQHELDHLNGIVFHEREIVKKIIFDKVKPNEKCPCNSGLKYKKCHGK